MTRYRFQLICPKCGKTSDTVQADHSPAPTVKCGDCLMDRVEVVGMQVISIEKVQR